MHFELMDCKQWITQRMVSKLYNCHMFPWQPDQKIGFLKREWTNKHIFNDIILMFKERNTHINHQKQTQFFLFRFTSIDRHMLMATFIQPKRYGKLCSHTKFL